MTEEACSSETCMGMDIELQEEIVTAQECGSLWGKVLFVPMMQCLSHGLENFLKQCQTLGHLDLCDYVQCNMSQQHYLHQSCRQKWLKLVKNSIMRKLLKATLQLQE